MVLKNSSSLVALGKVNINSSLCTGDNIALKGVRLLQGKWKGLITKTRLRRWMNVWWEPPFWKVNVKSLHNSVLNNQRLPSAFGPSIRLKLTPRSRVLHKFTVTQLLKKFHAFYGILRFVAVFIKAWYMSLSWGLPTKILYTFLTSPMCASCPAHLTLTVLRNEDKLRSSHIIQFNKISYYSIIHWIKILAIQNQNAKRYFMDYKVQSLKNVQKAHIILTYSMVQDILWKVDS
jgi:hypothetical protein